MNNPFAIIFTQLMERIKTEVPEIKYISQDFGQLEDYTNGRPAVAFPCALIDFQNWNFENMGDTTQRGEGDVIVKFGFARYADTNNFTDTQWNEAAMQDYETEWVANNALHCFSPNTESGALTRANILTENRPANVRVRTVRYRLSFEDYSTQPERTTIPRPGLKVTV